MLDVVDDGFYRFLVFQGVIWMPLGKYGVGDVALGTWFLRGVGSPIPVSSLDPSGAGPSLLLHLVFVPRGGVLTPICNNVETTAYPYLLDVED